MNHAGLSSPRIGGARSSPRDRSSVPGAASAEIPGAINGASTWDTRGTPGTRRAELRRRGMSSRHDSAAYFGRATYREDVGDVRRQTWKPTHKGAGKPVAAENHGLGPCHLSPTTRPHRWLVVPMRGGLRAS